MYEYKDTQISKPKNPRSKSSNDKRDISKAIIRLVRWPQYK